MVSMARQIQFATKNISMQNLKTNKNVRLNILFCFLTYELLHKVYNIHIEVGTLLQIEIRGIID